MILGTIYDHLDGISPFALQAPWDNSGLQLGSRDDRIGRIVLALDVTPDLVASLEPGTLVICHHPLIFSPIKALDADTPTGALVRQMVRREIACIAMHTNADVTHLNRYVATRVLGWQEIECRDFVCTARRDECTFDELVADVKARIGLDALNVVPVGKRVRRVALTTGSGGSLVDSVDADVFITGDLKYHDAMTALQRGIGVIDITHFASERYFGAALIDDLKTMPINATIRETKNPMMIV